MNENMKRKLEALPDKPGCYIMRDRRGAIIYVGKALSLRKRVRSYFRRGTLRSADPKLKGLINSVEDIDVVQAADEAEAILMEGRLIKSYRPRYNSFFKDDKRFLLIRTDPSIRFPRFELCRIKRNDDFMYFGPYASSRAARCALEFVEKRFGIRRCRVPVPGPADHKHCINDIVRFCAAPCVGAVSDHDYRARFEDACAFLRGERPDAFLELENEMNAMRESLDFEKAAALRDTLRFLRQAVRHRARVSKTALERSRDAMAGLEALRVLLDLSRTPRLIEAYDVSSISGTHAVAGLIVAVNGIPRPAGYRRFRIKTVDIIDDAGMMAEAIRRRFEKLVAEDGRMPDLVLVDGGAVQLRAAKAELRKLGLFRLSAAGLAKRFEELYWEGAGISREDAGQKKDLRVIRLTPDSPALNMLKRIRDEAHRFALDYHRRLRAKKIRESALDEIPGVGIKRKMLLLKQFGSVSRLAEADPEIIASVPGIGLKTAAVIKNSLVGGCMPKQARKQ